MKLDEYAKKILDDAGCDCYTYGGENSVYVMNDLKTAFPDGMEYPYIDVANAILAISRPEPIRRAPFKMLYSNEHTADAIPCESLEAAKSEALDTLSNWIAEEVSTWQSDVPTEKEQERYDYMIFNCWVSVWQYDPKTDDYGEVWAPSYEDEAGVGWLEWSELSKEKTPD